MTELTTLARASLLGALNKFQMFVLSVNNNSVCVCVSSSIIGDLVWQFCDATFSVNIFLKQMQEKRAKCDESE